MLRLRRALLLRAAAKDIKLCPEAARTWSAAFLAVRGQPGWALCCWFQICLLDSTPHALTCQSRELSVRGSVAGLPERSRGVC